MFELFSRCSFLLLYPSLLQATTPFQWVVYRGRLPSAVEGTMQDALCPSSPQHTPTHHHHQPLIHTPRVCGTGIEHLADEKATFLIHLTFWCRPPRLAVHLPATGTDTKRFHALCHSQAVSTKKEEKKRFLRIKKNKTNR